MAGYQVVEIASTKEGLVDVEALKKTVEEDTAGLMLTNPNTLGGDEREIAHNRPLTRPRPSHTDLARFTA